MVLRDVGFYENQFLDPVDDEIVIARSASALNEDIQLSSSSEEQANPDNKPFLWPPSVQEDVLESEPVQ